MSRIHEAMRTAALQGSDTDGSNPFSFSPELVKIATEPSDGVSVHIAGETTANIRTAAPASSDPLNLAVLRKHCTHPEWCPDLSVNVFCNSELSRMAGEQFRTFRSRLYQVRGQKDLRSILITSAVAREGKTFVTLNLAHGIVRQPDRRVLMIDADLRSSKLHVALGAPRTPGLSDYLSAETDEVSIIQSNPEGNLFFIPSGKQIVNPSELLASGRLKHLITRLAPLFDWILVDSPPCLPVTDANLAADACDALLLVVKANSTPAEVAQRAKHELHDRNVLGVVFNSVNEANLKYGEFYGGYPPTDGQLAGSSIATK